MFIPPCSHLMYLSLRLASSQYEQGNASLNEAPPHATNNLRVQHTVEVTRLQSTQEYGVVRQCAVV